MSTVPVKVLAGNQLSYEEERDRLHLEKKVEKAFYEAGSALKQIRARRLYRSSHDTFEFYCRERFGFTRQAANYLIAGASIYENLTTNGCQILPTSERQVRSLNGLESIYQCQIWTKAVDVAGGVVPSSRIVKEEVRRFQEKKINPLPFQVGEVCQIIAKDNPELKGKGGCWCIVDQVGEFSCKVNTWDSEYILRPEHLKSLNYAEHECQQMEELGVRMTKLHETGALDTAAMWVLNGLSKLTSPYLTQLEEKLLKVLEQEY
ncbi:hypothetical protein IQ238_28870 [Pleurocapsales cyanobacterium LEGE 06147]|nr:hypothetical protein [Pleurocapsales cyanobacterium LEGE 06147]